MLLAGGQGSRLYVLTKNRAKPAVTYGGKYRIIDFPLSNCIHSGIDTVGVLTQYEPLELNAYIGTGASWDLDGMTGGAYVLPPYVKGKAGQWYSGTANAIYQNISFIDRYNPDYIVVLSGDHIYKMDYSLMMHEHEENKADATIAVLHVPIEEASRFGIMACDENMQVIEFQEKPEQPKSDLASMGIYTFTWKKLREYLVADAADENSDHDFGKNIIPAMIANGEKLMAYPFEGYWKDVGTIQSLWEANMELLQDHPELDLYDKNWKIFSRNPNAPCCYVDRYAKTSNCMICEGCYIYGTVENSVLSTGVVVEKGAVVRDSILMEGCIVKENARVTMSIIDENTVVEPEARIGGDDIITVLGSNVKVESGARIPEGEMIQPGTVIEGAGGEA